MFRKDYVVFQGKVLALILLSFYIFKHSKLVLAIHKNFNNVKIYL